MNKPIWKKIILVGNALPAIAACLCFLGYGLVAVTGFSRIQTVTMIGALLLISLSAVFAAIRLLQRFSSSTPTLLQPAWQEIAALGLAFFAIVWIWLSAFLSGKSQGVGLSYYRKCVFYSLFIAGLFAITHCKSKRTQFWPSYAAGIIVPLFLISYVARIGTTYSGSTHNICLNLSNSNELGMVLCFCLVALFAWWIHVFFTKKRRWWLIIGVSAILLADLLLLYLSGARSAQLAAIVFVAGFFLLRLFKLKLSYESAAIFALFPIVFASIYLLIIFAQFGVDLTEATAKGFVDGKSLFTRLDIWIRGFKLLGTNPFFGNYYSATEGAGVSQLHNLSIDALSAFGIVGFMLVTCYLFFTFSLVLSQRRGEGNAISYATAAIACFIMISTFEASIANVPALLAICLPCFALKDFGEAEKEPLPITHYSTRIRSWNSREF